MLNSATSLPELERVSPDKSAKTLKVGQHAITHLEWTESSLLTDAWRDDPLVMVRVHAHIVAFQVKSILAIFHMFQFVLV